MHMAVKARESMCELCKHFHCLGLSQVCIQSCYFGATSEMYMGGKIIKHAALERSKGHVRSLTGLAGEGATFGHSAQVYRSVWVWS